MYSRKFTAIFHLLVTILLIKEAASSNQDDLLETYEPKTDDENFTDVALRGSYVATTPKIIATKPSAFRSGEDLDDNADDGDDLIVPQQQSVKSRQLSDSLNPLVQIFNTLTSALMKSASTTVPKTTAQLIGLNSNEELKGDNGGVSDNDDAYDTTEKAVETGRYIKGDPLNGYYDFVITEGSYKFWVVFQLGTAALLIYSTLAAIYYSKVNPLTSDYDYVDYLSRSFQGRAFSEDSADVEDETTIEPAQTYLSSLGDNKLFRAAAYGFQFAMDAIDKVPK